MKIIIPLPWMSGNKIVVVTSGDGSGMSVKGWGLWINSLGIASSSWIGGSSLTSSLISTVSSSGSSCTSSSCALTGTIIYYAMHNNNRIFYIIFKTISMIFFSIE